MKAIGYALAFCVSVILSGAVTTLAERWFT